MRTIRSCKPCVIASAEGTSFGAEARLFFPVAIRRKLSSSRSISIFDFVSILLTESDGASLVAGL